MNHYLHIFIAAILLTACQKESALQQFEQKLVEQGCNVVTKDDVANWIVWWTPDSSLYFKDLGLNKQYTLYSVQDSVKIDSVNFVSFSGDINQPLSIILNIIYDIDSISVTTDNNAIIIYPDPYSDIWLSDNPCVLLALPSLKAVNINYQDSFINFINTYYIDYSGIVGEIKFHVNTTGDIDFGDDTLMVNVIRGDYEYENLSIPLIQLPKYFAYHYKSEISEIANVCNLIVDLYSETNVSFKDFEDKFFVKAVHELQNYSTSQNTSLENSSTDEFMNECIREIDDELIRLAFVHGKIFNVSTGEMVEFLLKRHEDISAEITKTLLKARNIDEFLEIENLLNRPQDQRVNDLVMYISNRS